MRNYDLQKQFTTEEMAAMYKKAFEFLIDAERSMSKRMQDYYLPHFAKGCLHMVQQTLLIMQGIDVDQEATDPDFEKKVFGEE